MRNWRIFTIKIFQEISISDSFPSNSYQMFFISSDDTRPKKLPPINSTKFNFLQLPKWVISDQQNIFQKQNQLDTQANLDNNDWL